MTDRDDDNARLAELAPLLAPLDLDDTSAERIARRVRASVSRGPSPARFVEPLLVALATTAFFAWTLYKIYEVFH